jgi:hypothetical protein
LLVIGFAALLGWLPHRRLSEVVGEPSYLKSAYDEDTYALRMIEDSPSPFRLLATLAFRAVHAASGRNLPRALVVSDVVFPAVAALAAWGLASALVRRTPVRVLVSLLLLFGQDLVSLGCAAVWDPSGPAFLTRLRGLRAPWSSMLIPDYFTSYLALYRSPEPQVSLAVACATLAWTIRSVNGPVTAGACLGQGILNLLLAFSYVFLSVPVLVAQGLATAGLVMTGHRRSAAPLAAGVGGYVAAVLFLWPLVSTSYGIYTSTIFSSHLPSLTPTTFVCAVGVAVAFRLAKCPAGWSARHVVALALLVTPLVVTNQQLITGLMISARDWERYANHLFPVCGWALLCPDASRRTIAVCVAATILITARIWGAQARTYEYWLSSNLRAIATAKALASSAGGRAIDVPVVLADDPASAPLVHLLLDHRPPFLLYRDDVYTRPIADMPPGGGEPAGQAPYAARLAEFFSRTCRTAEDVKKLLAAEAASRSGFYCGFLFSLRDSWYPATDDRGVREPEVRRELERFAAGYAAAQAKRPAAWSLPAWLVTIDSEVSPGCESWAFRKLAESTVAGATARVWLQTPRPGPPPR